MPNCAARGSCGIPARLAGTQLNPVGAGRKGDLRGCSHLSHEGISNFAGVVRLGRRHLATA